ncbi:MAG: class I SAM-dependent RNA methyltransferase [Paracoccaceae bacterium]
MSTKHTIERLGHRGDGIAMGPVFAPGTLPGEEITGTLTGDRLSDIKIVTPSADRVRPPCPHFKACGGCSLQHASDEFLAKWKAQTVRDALSPHGLDAPIRHTITSPARSRRRATLSGRRTKKGALVGLHARASGAIVEIPECQLLHPDLIAIIPALQALTITGASRKGEVSFALTRSDAGVDVAVTDAKPLDGELRVKLAAFANRYDLARLSWGDELIAECRAPAQTIGVAKVSPPAGAFLQATEQGQNALVAAVKEAMGSAKSIVDLFAGCGTFALPLSQNSEIHAVEDDADMLAALDAGWRHAQGLKKITCETRDLFRRPLLAAELKKVDAVVIDPPRAGAEAQISELAKGSTTIAMVSCNPTTFARDAHILCNADYTIQWIDIIDQFRWSPHVELVALLSKK